MKRKILIAALMTLLINSSQVHAVKMNFPTISLQKLVEHMNKITGRNFIYDPSVIGGGGGGPVGRVGAGGPSISILAPEEMTVEEAYRAFLTALEMNGYTVMPSGKFLKIVLVDDALGQGVKTYKKDDVPDADTYVMRIYHVKHIDAKEIEDTLSVIMGGGGGPAPTFRGTRAGRTSAGKTNIVAYESTNSLFITGPGTAVNRVIEMIEMLDQKSHEVEMRPLKVAHANAVEIADQLDKIFDISASQGLQPPSTNPYRGRTGGPSSYTARSGAIIKKIVPDPRTNTLIVFANEEGFKRIEDMMKKLDTDTAGVSGQVHVYYLKNGSAKEVADTLKPLVQESEQDRARAAQGRTAYGPVPLAPETKPIFQGSVQISPNESTNSLVVTASPSDYIQLLEVIKSLDVARKQVYVEAIIADLSLDKNKTRGFSYSSGIPLGKGAILGGGLITDDLAGFLGNPANLRGGVVLGRSGGTYTITAPDGTPYRFPTAIGLLKFLESTSEADILQTPQLLAMDNSEAVFSSSAKYPRATTTIVGTPGTPNTQPLGSDEVKIELKIKPRINETNEYIQLDIEQRIEDINSNVPDAVKGLAGVSTINRYMKNVIVVRNEDTIVLGGLMRDNVTEAESKIPFLGDVPLLGWLFKSKSTKNSKTSLLLFLTPYIIDQPSDFRKIFDRKLGDRKDFIKKNFGGHDTKKEQINKDMNPPLLQPPANEGAEE